MNTVNNKHNYYQKLHKNEMYKCIQLEKKNKQLTKDFNKINNISKQLDIKDTIKQNKKELNKLKKKNNNIILIIHIIFLNILIIKKQLLIIKIKNLW